MAAHGSKGTIVFVHGAWCDASIWKEVFLPLAHEGFRIHAAQLALESFQGDVDALTRVLDHAAGPILLVGHSYAGNPISAAGNHPKVKALAFVAAATPAAGEPLGATLGMNPAAEPTTLTPDTQGFIWIDADFASRAMGQDLHRGYLNLLVATQRPAQANILSAVVDDPAWQHKPSSYLIATEDRFLAPATQRFLAERMGSRVEEVAASHLALLSQPTAVTDFIRRSAEALTT